METIYDVDYFIKKFEAIPEEKIIKYSLEDHNGGHCALGWVCDLVHYKDTPESIALRKLFNRSIADLNNGGDSEYQQPTPKQRILSALYDIKAKQQPKVESVKEKTVYVTVDSVVRELQKEQNIFQN